MTNKTQIFPVVVVIPSLNPDNLLLNTVAGLFSEGFTDVLIVDDGSRQECQWVFEELSQRPGCTILHHLENRGKGAALKTAFTYYLAHFNQQQYVGVVTADADGQHLPKDILQSANELVVRGGGALVLGARNFDEKIVPFKSRSGNKLTTKVFWLLHGKHISDTQTGLRAIPNTFLHTCLKTPGSRFEYEIHMLITAVHQSLEIVEVPIETVYFNNNRETHFRPVMDSIIIYSVFLKYAMTSLITAASDYAVFSLMYMLSRHLMAAMVIARAVATVISFSLQKKWVFGYQAGALRPFLKFVLLVIASGTASYLLIDLLLVKYLENMFIMKILAEAVVYLCNYFIQKHIVWKSGGNERKP